MTREAFIDVLRCSYEIEGDKIIVTHKGWVVLDLLEEIPSDVHFNNSGGVSLGLLKEIPSGVQFNNGDLVEFNSLKRISSSVQFNNESTVYLRSLTGDGFIYWEGNIKGINNKRLLNMMIKQGVFER
jgi:hypothetical protein